MQSAPGLQTMNAHRQVAFGGDVKLREEDLLLAGVREVWFPAVEPHFAHGGWHGIQKRFQVLDPIRRALGQIPRMITKAWQHQWIGPGQGQHVRPIRLACAIHNHALDSDRRTGGQNFRLASAKTVVLQMVMGVVIVHGRPGGGLWVCAKALIWSQILDSALRRLGVRCWVMPRGPRKAGSCATISAGGWLL